MHHLASLHPGHASLPTGDIDAGSGVTGRERVDQLRPVDQGLFDMLRQRQADPVAVVTAVARNASGPVGRDAPLRAGFTATTFTTVSLNPPRVSFCHDPAAPAASVLERAEHVAVHLLAANQTQAATIFATGGIDPFASYPYWESGPFGLPLLTGVLGRLLCRVVHRIPVGDRSMVIAEPLALSAGIDGDPLLHHHGGYATVTPV